MKRQVLIAFGSALLIGGGLGAACTVPQPALECNFQASSYWARYTLESGSGSCSTYEGDLIRFQRYLPPGETKPTFAFLSRRLGSITRARYDGDWRFDPADPDYQKEAPRGTFADLYPNASGFCEAESIEPADQSLPATTRTVELDDGGTEIATVPATHVREEWSNFRLLNNAQFVSTIWSADVTVIRDDCTAKYKVDALWPPIGCTLDEECNPSANLEAGRTSGSGLQAAMFKDGIPKCTHFAKHPNTYETTRFAGEPDRWVPGAAYPVGSTVVTYDGVYISTKYGLSDESGASLHPPSGTGTDIQDGTVTWRYVGPAEAAAEEVHEWTPAATYGAHELADGGVKLDRVTSNDGEYEVTVEEGISSGGPSGTGAGIVDGNTQWDFVNSGEVYFPKGVCLPTLSLDELAAIK